MIILFFGIGFLIYSLYKADDVVNIAGKSGAIYLAAAMPGLTLILVGSIATVVGWTAETAERMELKISEIESLIRDSSTNLTAASTPRRPFQSPTTTSSATTKGR